jgi:hypothetical protein
VTGSAAVRFPAFLALFALAPAFFACDGDEPPGVASLPIHYEASAPMGHCAAVEQQHGIEGQTHVPECSTIAYGTKPPSSGNHYGNWAAFKVYTNPIPPGYWVHDLEHGAVVLTYNCEDGCGGDVAAAEAMIVALPSDPLCLATATVPRRIVMTPDPSLDVQFAASAWGFTLRANCFDADVFRSFIDRHYGASPESVCGGGIDLATGVPPGCGGL